MSKPIYYPNPQETAECGYCGYRDNLTAFEVDGKEDNGSICPVCGDVADFPPLLDDQQVAQEREEA